MDVILIAAISVNGKIARNSEDKLDWSHDLWLFKEQTLGQTVILGSNTATLVERELEGRKVIVFQRQKMDVKNVLQGVKTDKCFIAGGSRTNMAFSEHLTHLYLTFHPLVLKNNALPLFYELKEEMNLRFQRKVEVDRNEGIYQFQYRIERQEV